MDFKKDLEELVAQLNSQDNHQGAALVTSAMNALAAPQQAVAASIEPVRKVQLASAYYSGRFNPNEKFVLASDYDALLASANQPVQDEVSDKEILAMATRFGFFSTIEMEKYFRKGWQDASKRIIAFSRALLASQPLAKADVAVMPKWWQPIESAPFQVDLLVLGQDGIVKQGYRSTQYKNDWTHWMPLPAAPAAQPQADK